MRKRTESPARGQQTVGQAVVEFALILPLAMLLVLAIGDFARLLTTALTVESTAREAADYGAFSASNWTVVGSTDNRALTLAAMQKLACTAASTLPDYSEPAGTVNHSTCKNPDVTGWTVANLSSVLQNPSGIDCTQPVPTGKLPCVVDVHLHYDFALFLGGAGVSGPGWSFKLPATIPIDRDASFVVNDFPSP